jgi:predicted dinucleotide-binding enzyme
MTTISIIGSGNMAGAIGARAAEHGHAVQIMSRSASKAQALADRIGHGATVGEYGEKPAGDLVVLAILYADAVGVVERYGQALSGKVLVDITNPFNADASGVVTSAGDSMAHRIAAAAPADAHVVKAFNTMFRGVIAEDAAPDAFYAGDDADAKTRVAEFLASLGMQPRDAGALGMAYALEWAGILLVGLAVNGAGFGAALKVEVH